MEKETRQLFTQAMNLGRNKDYEAALDMFTRVVSADPGNVRARYNIGVCLLSLGRYNESARAFKELLPDCPGDADIYNNMGKIMEKTGKPDAARVCYEKVLELDPGHPDALCRLGLLSGKYFGDPERALSLLKRAVEINDRFAEAHQGLGVCYHHLGDYNSAIEHLRLALKMDSNNAAVHNHLGIMYMKAGADDKAEEHFRLALAINPNATLRHENLWHGDDILPAPDTDSGELKPE